MLGQVSQFGSPLYNFRYDLSTCPQLGADRDDIVSRNFQLLQHTPILAPEHPTLGGHRSIPITCNIETKIEPSFWLPAACAAGYDYVIQLSWCQLDAHHQQIA